MWILIDNYDSFTHILHHYLLQTGHECIVLRNDALTVAELAALQPERLILSPGPETPLQAGITMEAIAHFYNKIPVLGICLGHQALGMFFQAPLLHLPAPVHGKTSQVQHSGHPLFEGADNPCTVMRYHSLTIDITHTPELIPIAHATDDQSLMACVHRSLPLCGIQFHPESIGTPGGKTMLDNWANKLYTSA
jgi:anthranilate synthase/aminodeoxychorismate synthase-like glutamine amidotransferase